MDKEKLKEIELQIKEKTSQITKLVKEAQALADEHGLSFYVSLNGTGGTYYGENMPQEPNEDDFPDTPEGDKAYDEAYAKWEEQTDGNGSHPWGDYGWVNSSFDC